MISQTQLTTDSLSRAVDVLLVNPEKLAAMRTKSLERARPTAAADIARHVLQLIANPQRAR